MAFLLISKGRQEFGIKKGTQGRTWCRDGAEVLRASPAPHLTLAFCDGSFFPPFELRIFQSLRGSLQYE